MRACFIALVLLLFGSVDAFGKLKVVATTADVRSLVEEVVKDSAEIVSIAKGSQDPHFIEAKPSYMISVRDADLFVVNGLSLEIGWVSSLIRGARNPKVAIGTKGYLDLGTLIDPIDKPTGKLSRSQGDVHPDGNPHFTLDPIRCAELAVKIAERLGELDPVNKGSYAKNASIFKTRLNREVEVWSKRIAQSKVEKVVTYHPTLNYFMNRFGIQVADYLEDKPGIPPTAQHILSVIEKMKKEQVKLILVDNFFDTKIADRVAREVPGARVLSVGVSVDATSELKALDDVTEQLVKAIEGK